MKNPFRLKRFLSVFLFTLLFSSAGSALRADSLRANLGLWAGNLKPELEERFFYDGLLSGASFGRFTLPWEGLSSFAFYPLGFEYVIEARDQKFVFGANLIYDFSEASYSSLTFGPSISQSTLKKYSVDDWEAYLGYVIELSDKARFTPRVGFRRHRETFDYQEITLGPNRIATTFQENPWEAQALSLYIAAEIRIAISDKLSFVGDLLFAPPFFANWIGDMRHERILIGSSGGAPFFQYDSATAGYEMDFNRIELGLEYKVSDALKVRFGIRQEVIEASYPNYFNIPLSIDQGAATFGFDVVEFLTDYVIYNSKYRTERGLIYVSGTYSLEL